MSNNIRGLPSFQLSGAGLNVDLMNVKTTEVISLGWWKGQFRRRLEQVTGKKTVDGVLCYDTSFGIGRDACSNENTQEFLKMIGFVDSQIKSLCSSSHEEGIKDIMFRWRQNFEFKQKDFEDVYKLLANNVPVFHRLELTNIALEYKKTAPRQAIAVHQVYTDLAHKDSRIRPPNYPWEKPESGVHEIPSSGTDYDYLPSGYLNLEEQRLELFDIAGIVIPLDNDIKQVLKAMLYLSGDKLLPFDSVSTESTTDYEKELNNGIGGVETWTKVTALENYSSGFLDSFISEFPVYEKKEVTGYVDDGDEGISDIFGANDNRANPTYSNYFWLLREMLSYVDGGNLTSGLFIETQNGDVYMTVDGLDNIAPRELQKGIASHADVYVGQKSCTDFFNCLWDGVMQILAVALNIIAQVLWYFPAMRISMQIVIFALSGGTVWADTKQEFVIYTPMIIITAAALAVSLASFGTLAAPMQAFSAAMMTYSMYNTYENIGAVKDSIEYAEEMKKLSEAEQKIIEEAMDETEVQLKAGKGEVDTEMFMPLDVDMKKLTKDPYGDDSQFNIDFGKGIENG